MNRITKNLVLLSLAFLVPSSSIADEVNEERKDGIETHESVYSYVEDKIFEFPEDGAVFIMFSFDGKIKDCEPACEAAIDSLNIDWHPPKAQGFVRRFADLDEKRCYIVYATMIDHIDKVMVDSWKKTLAESIGNVKFPITAYILTPDTIFRVKKRSQGNHSGKEKDGQK